MTEVVHLGRYERAAQSLERMNRLVVCLFLALVAFQLVLGSLAAAGLLDFSVMQLPNFTNAQASTVVIAGGAWLVAGLLFATAINIAPRWLVASVAAFLAVTWLIMLALMIGVAGFVLNLIVASGITSSGVSRELSVLAIVTALALIVVTWTGAQPFWAFLRGLWTTLTRTQSENQLARGVRGVGLFSTAGALAAFDLPVVLGQRGALAGKLLAFAGILIASVSVGLWLVLPLNVSVLFILMAYSDCGADNVNAGAVDVASCIVSNTPRAMVSLIAILLVALVACLIGAVLMLFAKRALARALTRDSARAPIVFLRSFADDQGRVRAPRRNLLGIVLDLGRAPGSMDQILVYEFARQGPVTALGKPGEKSPPFGAHRIYAAHETWRDDIAVMIDASLATVLIVDDSEGLTWELEQSLARAAWLEKTLFILPRAEHFDRLAAVAGEACAAPELHRAEQVIGAYCSNSAWRFFVSRRPTRVTYQAVARLFFEALKARGVTDNTPVAA